MRSNARNYILTAACTVAALFLCPSAHATAYLFTSGTAGNTETIGTPPITVWGYTYNGSTTGSGSSISLNGAALSNLSYSSSYGLGVGATSNEITLDSAVVIDFADPNSGSTVPGGPELNGATAVTFTIDNADSGWIIYGGNTAPTASSVTGLKSLVTGSGNGTQTVSLSGYAYLVVSAAQTCELNIHDLSTTTATPEPGTTMMAGMALIGLAMALRKARKRS